MTRKKFIRTLTRNKKSYLFVLLLLLVAVTVWVKYGSNQSGSKAKPVVISNPTKKIDYSPATKADNAPNESRKGSTNPSPTLNNYTAPKNTGQFTATITRAGLDSGKQNLEAAAVVNGASEGTCTFNIHQDGQATISKSENITLQVSNYVCSVIKIPTSQFPAKGDWFVSLTVESSGKTVTTDWVNNPVSVN